LIGRERPEASVDQSSTTPLQRIDPEQWVDEYGDYLYRYAYSRLRDSNSAEEVVQETFLAGIRFREQYSGQGSERGWLLGILKRKIVDFVRLRSKHARAASYEDEDDPSAQLFDEKGNWRQNAMPSFNAAEQRVLAGELWEVVQGCMEHLPSGQADVFVLSVMEEMDSNDICRELEITSANLWTRLHRARLGLAKCVGARWFTDGERPNQAHS